MTKGTMLTILALALCLAVPATIVALVSGQGAARATTRVVPSSVHSGSSVRTGSSEHSSSGRVRGRRPGRHRGVASKSTSTTTVPRAQPIRSAPVTMTELPLVDTSRPVVSGGVVLSPERSLPTYVWLPAAPGRYPLVVFAPGFTLGPASYARFCSTLASSGYVVASPSFPLEDPSQGYGLDRSDLPNEPADVSFVITRLLQGSLASHIVPNEIAVAGHSDGADVALMIGYQQGKVDPRVKAVIAIAPDAMTGTVVPSSVPLLLEQGDDDSVVPYSNSQTVFQQVPAPRFYLTLLGADHASPILGGSPWTPVLDSSVAEFLDATLAGRGPGVSALPGELGASSLVRLQVAG